MPCNTNLPGEQAVVANFCGAGDACLCCDNSILSYFNIMGNLYEVVKFYALFDQGRVAKQSRAVNYRVSTNSDIVFNNHIAKLWYRFVSSIFLWCKSKSIASDNSTGVN